MDESRTGWMLPGETICKTATAATLPIMPVFMDLLTMPIATGAPVKAKDTHAGRPCDPDTDGIYDRKRTWSSRQIHNTDKPIFGKRTGVLTDCNEP
jgi:hypothetical protein